jgi:hypothetical protein
MIYYYDSAIFVIDECILILVAAENGITRRGVP